MSLTKSASPPSNTKFHLSRSVIIPKEFDYSTEHFNLDIDQLYPDHRNSVENTSQCEAHLALIGSIIGDFDNTMERHETRQH
jgi:hypothetical protein